MLCLDMNWYDMYDMHQYNKTAKFFIYHKFDIKCVIKWVKNQRQIFSYSSNELKE